LVGKAQEYLEKEEILAFIIGGRCEKVSDVDGKGSGKFREMMRKEEDET
jgi:hypothetical protein